MGGWACGRGGKVAGGWGSGLCSCVQLVQGRRGSVHWVNRCCPLWNGVPARQNPAAVALRWRSSLSPGNCLVFQAVTTSLSPPSTPPLHPLLHHRALNPRQPTTRSHDHLTTTYDRRTLRRSGRSPTILGTTAYRLLRCTPSRQAAQGTPR